MNGKSYFESHIVYFVYLLRKQGLKVGTAELIDALKAVSVTGVRDPHAFKMAMRATLVKKSSDYGIFNNTFEKYFTPRWKKEAELERGRKFEEEFCQSVEKAEQDLQFMGEQLNMGDTEKVVFASLPLTEKERIKQFIDETEKGNKVNSTFKPILESIVKGSLRYWQNRQDNTNNLRRPEPVTGDAGWDWMLSGEGGTASSEASLKDIDMSLISGKDIPEAAEIIRRMSRRLAGNLSRRYRVSKKKKELDLRRTIRDNISYGGYLYRLKYRHPGRSKPRLLLLCDVSGSMISYTGFILPFIYGLNVVISDIESFVFAEKLERITSYMERGVSFEDTIKEIMERNVRWGGGTKIDEAVRELMNKYDSVITPKTIVIVVSDTKTTSLSESLEAVKELRSGVKDIIWLNTLASAEWDRFRSVGAFNSITRMFPCNRLADLENIFDSIII